MSGELGSALVNRVRIIYIFKLSVYFSKTFSFSSGRKPRSTSKDSETLIEGRRVHVRVRFDLFVEWIIRRDVASDPLTVSSGELLPDTLIYVTPVSYVFLTSVACTYVNLYWIYFICFEKLKLDTLAS